MGEVRRRGPDHEAFFGRRKGKALRGEQERLVLEMLPRLRAPASGPLTDLRGLFPRPVGRVRLEIGFGGGEHLIAAALREPDVGFIGAEPYVNGVAKVLARIAAERIDNIVLWDEDVRPLLDRLPEAGLDRVYLYYPDPWPKRRHFKRRFVVDENVARLARVIAPGGTFRFASDWADYAAWTLAHVRRAKPFAWTAERASDWLEPWSDWIRTRYETKAIREGRLPTYLTFARV